MTRLRWMWVACAAIALSLFMLEPAFAQQAGVTGSSWKELVATLINTAGVMLLVQGIKLAVPYLSDKYGWALPMAAMILGPLVATAQAYLSAKLGYPVDLNWTLINTALTGAGAVAAHQIYTQHRQGPTGIAMRR